jgi:DNA helicase-2/ATP-dependent DNA helicase PcrA
MPSPLDKFQRTIAAKRGNSLVVACPGAGKTSVLTHRIVADIALRERSRKLVAAITYTNRAADEIMERVESLSSSNIKRIWTGTIHSFCLQFILKPYAGYSKRIERGFSIVDGDVAEQIRRDLIKNFRLKRNSDFTRTDRMGKPLTTDDSEKRAFYEYHSILAGQKLIDYDSILSIANHLFDRYPAIASEISRLFGLICVDEYQDTTLAQFDVLQKIICSEGATTKIFLVGDPDQCIYASLGGGQLNEEQIKSHFKGIKMPTMELRRNYRSQKKIVEFSKNFRDGGAVIQAMAPSGTPSSITYNDSVDASTLPGFIAQLVKQIIGSGACPSEICILAPRRALILDFLRAIVRHHPELKALFASTALSPFRREDDSIWYDFARIMLTAPHPTTVRSRLKWATAVVSRLEVGDIMEPGELLRRVNSSPLTGKTVPLLIAVVNHLTAKNLRTVGG